MKNHKKRGKFGNREMKVKFVFLFNLICLFGDFHFDFDSTLAVPTLPFEVLFFFFLAIPISCFALIYLCLAYCSFRISTSLRKKFNQIKGRGPRRRRAAGWPDLINNQKQQQLQTKKYIFIAFYI